MCRAEVCSGGAHAKQTCASCRDLLFWVCPACTAAGLSLARKMPLERHATLLVCACCGPRQPAALWRWAPCTGDENLWNALRACPGQALLGTGAARWRYHHRLWAAAPRASSLYPRPPPPARDRRRQAAAWRVMPCAKHCTSRWQLSAWASLEMLALQLHEGSQWAKAPPSSRRALWRWLPPQLACAVPRLAVPRTVRLPPSLQSTHLTSQRQTTARLGCRWVGCLPLRRSPAGATGTAGTRPDVCQAFSSSGVCLSL